jgi:hypothetical protein
LKAFIGKKEFTVSDVPYTSKFGNDQAVRQSLAKYIDSMRSHTVVGSPYPWYIFVGNDISSQTELHDSPVKWKDCPTPDIIQFAFEKLVPDGAFGKWGVNDIKTREHFTNAQWGVGVEGSGAPVHFHNAAWNAVVYGAKYWLLYPPHDRILSNSQILKFVKDGEMEAMRKKGARVITCVQTAGDILVVPENWAHGVLNIQESVAVATEVVTSHWRSNYLSGPGKPLGLLRM